MSQSAAVLGLWERFFPPRYRIDQGLLDFSVFDCPLYLPSASIVSDDAFVLVKSSATGRVWPGEPGDTAHIAALAFRSQRACEAVLAQSSGALVESGYVGWTFGADWRHFFPGVPEECTDLARLLLSHDLQPGGEVFDVERDLQSYDPPIEPSPFARPCVSEDRGALDSLLANEFSPRWRKDAMDKHSEDPARVIGLFLDGECRGFAMTQMDGDANRRAGAVWSADLGPHWAALGPIGVARRVRDQGHGHALLAAALCRLRDLGARQTIIDWTTLAEFYGRHGFQATRRYRSYTGPLTE